MGGEWIRVLVLGLAGVGGGILTGCSGGAADGRAMNGGASGSADAAVADAACGGAPSLGGGAGANGVGSCPSGSTCLAPRLIPTLAAPSLVAVTATYFYYTMAPGDPNKRRLWRAPVSGGYEQNLFDGGPISAIAIDPADTFAYLALGGSAPTILRLPLTANGAAGAGTALTPQPSSGYMSFNSMILDGESLYYISRGDPAMSGLFKIPATGGAPVMVLKSDEPGDVRLHGDYIYFSGNIIREVQGAAGIVRIPRAGGTAQLLYTSTGLAPSGIVVSDSGIYWDIGALMRIPLDGGSPVTLFTPPSARCMHSNSTGFAVAEDAIYYAFVMYNPIQAQVMRIPLDGGVISTPFSTGAFLDLGNIVPVGGTVYFSSSSPTTPGIIAMDACGCAPAP